MKSKLVLFSMVSFLAISVIQAKQVVQSDIFYEIAQGNKKAIKSWLKSKPDLSIRNSEGQTVLVVAALTGQREVVKMLVKAGAVVNAIDNVGKTALDHAVEFGHVKMICDLVKQGGKVTTSDNLYHLKSVMKDRAVSLIVRFGLLFLMGGIIFMPISWLACLPLITNSTFLIVAGWTVASVAAVAYLPYFWSLPCRAYSWNKASNENWMLSTRTISLN